MSAWLDQALAKLRGSETQIRRSLTQFDAMRDDDGPIVEWLSTEAVIVGSTGEFDGGTRVPAVVALSEEALYIATGKRWPTAARLAFDALESFSLVPYDKDFRRLVLVGVDRLTSLVQRGAEENAAIETMAVTGREMAIRQPAILFRLGSQPAEHFLGALARRLTEQAPASA